jgi:hypothetical protein
MRGFLSRYGAYLSEEIMMSHCVEVLVLFLPTNRNFSFQYEVDSLGMGTSLNNCVPFKISITLDKKNLFLTFLM